MVMARTLSETTISTVVNLVYSVIASEPQVCAFLHTPVVSLGSWPGLVSKTGQPHGGYASPWALPLLEPTGATVHN